MVKCKCGNENHSTIVVHTETTFGHGDSSHTCYVRCAQCGNRGQKSTGPGIFLFETFRKAQADWDSFNTEE